MKVLVCIPCLLTGGTEVQTLSLVEALVRAGHKVAVACYFEYQTQMVERFRSIGAEVRLMNPAGLSRPAGVVRTVAFLYKGLKKIVKDFRPDVAHVQYMAPGALAIFILKLLGTKKIVATTHTAADIYSKSGLRIVLFIAKYCTVAFQCITLKAEKNYFGSASLFDGTPRKHFTIYNTLPSHITIRQTPRNFNQETITIGVVSRLAEIKGMDLVVPVFAKAATLLSAAASASIPALRLLIVGDGAQRELMKQQAAESEYSEHIAFAGRKGQHELQAWYDKIDILLMPSRSEGFGLTAIEGMARGCVPVVSNIGGLPEVITADSGLLHRPEDIKDMADKIYRLATNPALLNRLSQGCLRRAADFAPELYQEKIKELYSLL